MKQLIRIQGARLIDPETGRDGPFDVRIEGDRIAAVDRPDAFGKPGENEVVVDARGLWLMPGFVDMHVHLREPGEEYKEDLESGLRAAAASGFAAVCCMPNTIPPNDTRAVTELLLRRSAQVGASRLYPVASITKGREGKVTTEMGDLLEAGAVAFSDDGRSVPEASVMRRAMEYAAGFDALIAEHAEDATLTRGGVSHEGKVGVLAGLGGMPVEAEEIVVARDIILARMTGARLHLCHVSSKGTVEMLRRAKEEGLAVSAEVTPHHLLLTDEATRGYDTNTKVNPPLRSEDHREALLRGLREGVIDAVATDHAPHSIVEKEGDYASAAFGISGLETAVPLMLHLVDGNLIKPADMARALSSAPCRILRIPGGRVEEGGVANLTLLDPKKPFTVAPEKFVSKGKNSPFGGWKVPGRSCMTILEGKIIFNSFVGPGGPAGPKDDAPGGRTPQSL